MMQSQELAKLKEAAKRGGGGDGKKRKKEEKASLSLGDPFTGKIGEFYRQSLTLNIGECYKDLFS